MTESGYVFRPMNDGVARAVVAWRYEAPYDFYDIANDPEGLEDLLGPPERRRGYCFDYADDGSVDIGLGLRPDLTSRGLGLEFLLAGLECSGGAASHPPASAGWKSIRTTPTAAITPSC